MFERCLYFNLNALSRQLNRRWEEAFAPFALTPSHAYVLRAVLAEPGRTQQALADDMRLEKSTLARFLNALEAQGMVERRPSASSARSKEVHPTKDSLSIAESLEATGDRLYADMCAAIGKERLDGFVTMMKTVAGSVGP
ncbi:MAG: MarR family transcriptional regulator [Pseudomonadota bacterium]